MAQSHLEQVLTATGLPADQVKALVDLADDAPDFKTDAFVAPIRTNVETAVKNDPAFYESLNKENLPKDFLKTIESEQYGRAANIVRTTMLKATGLSEQDFADLGETGKKIEIFTPAFVAKLSAGKVTDKELQTKLMEANAKIQEMEQGQPEIEAKFKTQYEQKWNEQISNTNVLTSLTAVEGLKAPAKYLAGDIVSQLRGKYHLHNNETGGTEIRQKDKPDLKVLVDNGTKELTLVGAIQSILEADKLVDPKKTTTSTTTTTVTTEGGKGFKMSSNVNDKVAKRIAEDAKAGG